MLLEIVCSGTKLTKYASTHLPFVIHNEQTLFALQQQWHQKGSRLNASSPRLFKRVKPCIYTGQLLPPWAGKDRYWTYKHMVLQIEDCIDWLPMFASSQLGLCFRVGSLKKWSCLWVANRAYHCITATELELGWEVMINVGTHMRLFFKMPLSPFLIIQGPFYFRIRFCRRISLLPGLLMGSNK